MQKAEVWRGAFGDAEPPFGPLPGALLGDVLAYEFELPERFVPKGDYPRLERTFVLVDLGVSMSLPKWHHVTVEDQEIQGIDPDLDDAVTWYVDLVEVTRDGDAFVVRDLYVDVMVPTDGRHHRMLDLDEFADAIEAGVMSTEVAVDGLRRWQRFLDRHLHSGRDPRHGWTDFPPQVIGELMELPAPLGPIIGAP